MRKEIRSTSLLFLIICLAVSTTNAQNKSIEGILFELPDVIFSPIEAPLGSVAAFELRIKQPVDHTNPAKGYFYQRAFLTHRGFDQPTVLVTEGYAQPRNYLSEPSQLLNANQLIVEHRYFGKSIPENLDYTYLTLEQVTADLHKIVSIFKQIYAQKWISTGISKGGQTTIYYRYFFPNDVEVSIPYVAPFNLSLQDERIYHFLDTIGSDDCRKSLLDVQRRILQNREETLELLRWYAYGAGLSFAYLGFEKAFEYTVLEYPFSFWQWGFSCNDIPDSSATLEETLVHMLNISGIDFFSDSEIETYGSHFYQAATQMGYYGYQTDSLKNYLRVLSSSSYPGAVFPPRGVYTEYDSSLALDVYQWLQEKGEQFIYIYGGTDTWTATAIPENTKLDALWVVLNGADHASARMTNMLPSDQERVRKKLEKWLELEIYPNNFP